MFPAAAQAQEDAMLLVAHPAFRDLEYRQTVLLAAPAPNGGHVGVIINRPTRRSLGSLFPEHEPSKKVVEPVYYGGPFSRGALVALVRADAPRRRHGAADEKPLPRLSRQHHRPCHRDHAERGALFVGYVGWRPGELKARSTGGSGRSSNADVDIVFRKDTESLWEELQQASKRIRAEQASISASPPSAFQGWKFTPAAPVAHDDAPRGPRAEG